MRQRRKPWVLKQKKYSGIITQIISSINKLDNNEKNIQ